MAKSPKVMKHGVAMFGQARVRTNGGGLHMGTAIHDARVKSDTKN